ncbi:MAG: UpxY family transcription antiterminator [Chitinophagaceae bacterium]
MNAEKKWHVVYTRPRWEKKVSTLLTKKRITNYCPLNRVLPQWAARKKTVHEPLFTSYVFIHASEMEHLAIKQTDGIFDFVYWLDKPAVIRDEEMDTLKSFLEDNYNVRLEKIKVNVNDKVRIISGPLMTREGEILEAKSRTVKVFLPSLGYAMIAEVKTAEVEIIDPLLRNQKVNTVIHAR